VSLEDVQRVASIIEAGKPVLGGSCRPAPEPPRSGATLEEALAAIAATMQV